MQIPFCHKFIEVGAYISQDESFRRDLALLEVLGLPYYESLLKQGLKNIDVNGQIRKVLEEKGEMDA